MSHRWFEIDPGWWLIKVLSWVGLAKVRLSELKLVADQLRPKIQQPS